MPLPDHVDSPSRRHRSYTAACTTQSSAQGRQRHGVPMIVGDSSASILAPLLSNLPSISGISRLLPMSPPKQSPATMSLNAEDSLARWQETDLGDGRKSRLLLITSPAHALQVFSFRKSVIPSDPHVAEVPPSPEEIVSIPNIKYTEDVFETALPGVNTLKNAVNERVLSAHVIDKALWDEHGPAVALTVISPLSKRVHGHIALILVSLTSCEAFRRVDLGIGLTASVTSSSGSIMVSLSHPTPSVHFFNRNLSPTHAPITHLPCNATTLLPITSLSGRLLAFATREPPPTPGPDGLGSIVVASSERNRAPSAESIPPNSSPTTQAALLNSAVEIGGGVARGVWAGIKMGAAAAGKASSGRLAQSAPTESVAGLTGDETPPIETDSERSIEDEQDDDQSVPAIPSSGAWVKVVDIFPRGAKRHDSAVEEAKLVGPDLVEPDVIAHFRLPSSRNLMSPLPSGNRSRRQTSWPELSIAYLSFSPHGLRLFAAGIDGRAFHIVDVRPWGARIDKRSGCKGEVWNSYVLRRGNTSADVCSVSWDDDERWIAVGTGKGTVHIFPISPSGGKPSAASHIPLKITNPQQLPPLSVEISPCVRLRPMRSSSSEDLVNRVEIDGRTHSFALASFISTRPHPRAKGLLCQDIAIYRPAATQLELVRLTAQTAIQVSPEHNATTRRGSNLTEMMREKAKLAPDGDLVFDHSIKARWAMPLGQGSAETPVGLFERKLMKSVADTHGSKSLHRAEIRTHSSCPRILPSSIYLSRQFDFFAAVPTDEYSPLSVLDKVARTRRLVFRPQVEAHASSPDVKSFDEPLLSALHSVIESRPTPQVPGLPNGYPSKHIWSVLPIRHVAANLGEGVDRVRREYARAQHSRLRRRSEAVVASNNLSFEDDAVFASCPPDDSVVNGDIDAASSPSSGEVPVTNTDSSQADDDRDDGWGEGWEEEYRRAVEDDGGPDDLVLGLMDEEEEERRKWDQRQKRLAEQSESLK